MSLARSAEKSVPALIFCGVALTMLTACHPARLGQGQNRDDRAVTVDARLDCPQRQGGLARVDIAADGRSCRYADDQGREAVLKLMDLAGRSPKDALTATEIDLKALVPAAAAPSDDAVVTGNTTGDGDHTRIDLPGIHIEADGNDHAHIRAFGQSVDAQGNHAVIHGGWNGRQATVIAHDKGVEVRAGWIGARSVDTNYLLASETAGPSGVHAAGYHARGSIAGPLVIGIETSKSEDDHDQRHDDFKDLRRLVDRNVQRS